MPESIVDAAVLSSISHLELIARQAVEGALSGLHHSHFMGRNVEFSEHRLYHPGDELRLIDWRAYAKTDRFHVKLFEEDTNLRAMILTDMSGSMRFGETGKSKLLYAQQLTASLSHLILSQGDSVGVLVFDDIVRSYIPPRNRTDQWGGVLDILTNTVMSNDESAIADVLAELGEVLKKRGLVILVSDLIDDPDRVLQNLALLKKSHQEVLVFHILSPEEIELPFYGTVEFHPLEGESDSMRTVPRRLQKKYQERVQRFLRRYREGCVEFGIEYNLLRTDQPLEKVLREYLQRRLRTRNRS
ncbi:MAG: DUF58 domain-containing protein [Candidatus Omnitrophica bacterium]|nr:DUF58 domain-containing protein [Candidatus Omnitrophota bacterium]